MQKYTPEINKRIRPHLKLAGASYRVDETYIKIGKSCKYLYRTFDSTEQTIEFMLSAKRNVSAAKRIFKKMMKADSRPRSDKKSLEDLSRLKIIFATEPFFGLADLERSWREGTACVTGLQ